MTKNSMLDFPWRQSPAPGFSTEVLPGLTWACMPLPFALNHVNIWLLDDLDSLLVIDTGIATKKTKSCWEQLLSDSRSRLSRLLITHYHPDHIGLTGWLSRGEVPVLASASEWQMALNALQVSGDAFSDAQEKWYSRHGLDPQRRQALINQGNTYQPLVEGLTDNPVLVSDGDTLSINNVLWQVITVGGHAPEMICLHSEELSVLISADHILPTITPNIEQSFYTIDDDPLNSYLDSLKRMKTLAEDVLVLPSHGLPFRGLHQRIESIAEHHSQRIDLLLSRCMTPHSAAEALNILFPANLASDHLMFAMGESVAHLVHMQRLGLVQAFERDGVAYFETV